MTTEINTSLQLIGRPVTATSQDVAELKRLQEKLFQTNGRGPAPMVERFSALQDLIGHSAMKVAPTWRGSNGTPLFSTGTQDTSENSLRYIPCVGRSIRAWRSGEFIDVGIFEQGKPVGHAWRIHEREWSASPVDQLALLKLANPAIQDDDSIDQARNALNELVPGGNAERVDWAVKLDLSAPGVLNAVAPKTASAMREIKSQNAYFSTGQPDWAMTAEEFLASKEIVDLDLDQELELREIAGRNLDQVADPTVKGHFLPVYDQFEPDTKIIFSKNEYVFRGETAEPVPLAIRRNGMFHLFDGRYHGFEHLVERTGGVKSFSRACESDLRSWHRSSVEKALLKRLPVPREVLEEYPSLRRRQAPNLAGDNRPMPEFETEDLMLQASDLESSDASQLWSALYDYEREGLEGDWGLQQSFVDEAKKEIIQHDPESRYQPIDTLIELGENASFAGHVEEEVEADFRKEHGFGPDDPILPQSLQEDLRDRIADALIDRIKEEATEDIDHQAWDWEQEDDFEILEAAYEKESEYVTDLLNQTFHDLRVIEGTDPEELVSYSILRNADGEYHLFEDLMNNSYASHLGEYSDYERAVTAAKNHAYYGYTTRDWPVNHALDDTKWMRRSHNSTGYYVADGQSGFRYERKGGWQRGAFVVTPPFDKRPGWQAVHLPTGLPVGKVWGGENEAKRFVDILRSKMDWAALKDCNEPVLIDLIAAAETDATQQAEENHAVMRNQQRQGRRARPVPQTIGFAGPVAFSTNLLDIELPAFDLDRYSEFKPTQQDRNWLISQMRDAGDVAEEWLDEQFETYTPGRQAIDQWGQATVFNWHHLSDEEKSPYIELMAEDETVKSQVIFIELADEFEAHLAKEADERLEHFKDSVVLEDLSGQGYRVIFSPSDPTGMEVFAPGPISDDTFLGYASGSDALETLDDVHDITGQYALRGTRAIDGRDLFDALNPQGPDSWRPRVLVLSENTPCVSRLAHGFSRKSFGLVRTDWHLGEDQPGVAVIHLATGSPIKPFFRRDKDAMAFAELIEMQADWQSLTDHEDFQRESANLRDIAKKTSAAVHEVARAETRRERPKTKPRQNVFSGAVAFKTGSGLEKHERDIIKTLERIDPSRTMPEKWRDFLTLASCAHKNAALPRHSEQWRANETKYMDVVERYKAKNRREDITGYAEALGSLSMAASQPGDDTLGRLHMEIAPNTNLGQFYTPYSIAQLMAKMSMGNLREDQLEKLGNGSGYLEMSDPACGAGVMALATIDEFGNQGINPQKHLRAYLTDVDERACDMAFLNMALRGIPAVITHGNALSGEVYGRSMTAPYVNARYEDLMQKREAVNVQAGGLFEPKFSTGRDYRDLSKTLQSLGAGPDLLNHNFVPFNDPRKGVPGEYARLQDVKELLWHANLVFDEAEKMGFAERHPERDAMPPHKLYDDHHQALGPKIGAFLDNLELVHPTTRRQANSLLSRIADYEKLFNAYVANYGTPETTYEALATPRWKVGEAVPVFGSEEDMAVDTIDLINAEEAIQKKVDELIPFYERKVRLEKLSQHGADFTVTDDYIAAIAKNRKEDAINKLAKQGIPATEDAIEHAAIELVADEIRRRGLYSGDIDETGFMNVHGDNIVTIAEWRAREAAFNELNDLASKSIADQDGQGYVIRKSPDNPLFQLSFLDMPIASVPSYKQAVLLATQHALGSDIDALQNPDLPLNPLGPDDHFVRRTTVFAGSQKINEDQHSILKLVDPVVRGHFAVSKSVDSKPGWFITHLPTGYRCSAKSSRFASEGDARECVEKLQPLADWNFTRRNVQDWMNAPDNQDLRHNCFALIENEVEASILEARKKRAAHAQNNRKSARGGIAGPVAFKAGLSDAIADEKANKLRKRLLDELLTGKQFKSVRDLRAFSSGILGMEIRAKDPSARAIEEIAEQAMVRAAEQITAKHEGSTANLIEKMSNLQRQLPNFSTRTSRSVELQAYSTPLPIAVFANRLLDAKEGETVYDPAAGNGALLIGQRPTDRAVNELDRSRARTLEAKHGWSYDAVLGKPARPIHHMIANPPFGALEEHQGKRQYLLSNGLSPDRHTAEKSVATSRLHHAIVWNGLTSLPEDGRAVLILPSVSPIERDARASAYDEAGLRRFHWKLYDSFNVVEHVTLSGDMYRPQGAGWPVDIIVIDGKGRSNLPLPTLSTPPIIPSLDALKEICNVYDDNQQKLDKPTSLSAIAKLHSNGESDLRNSTLPERDDGGESAKLPNRSARKTYGDRGSRTGRDGKDRNADPGAGPEHRSSPDVQEPGIPGVAASADVGSAASALQGNSSTPETVRAGRTDDGARSMREALVTYKPLSNAKPLDTLMPSNLVNSFEKAKERLIKAVGNVDTFVQEKLGYDSQEKLFNALSAEQIDATAFAIHEHETGGSFINGHLMGIGKGRVAAAMIVYAHRNGLTPIFFTERPNLYPAIMRDLADIGYGHLRPLITNDGLTGQKALELPDGRVLSTPNKAKHDAELIRIRDQGHLGKDYDFLMTTWAQTQTVNGQNTLRRMLLERLGRKALLIRDESHNAGGQDNLFRVPGPANRAEFARELMWDASGVYDSSATWAKAPHTMDLYGRTDLRHAVRDPKQIGSIIAAHGLPMQQMVASMLTESGQYMRLERSMEGIDYNFSVVDIDEGRFDKFAAVLEAISDFDRAKQDLLKGPLGDELKRRGEKVIEDGATGDIGVKSVNFASLLHNIAHQAEVALMADTVADKAIETLKDGKKPFITLANTMGAFLADFASDNELAPGDSINANFGDVLKRYLDRSRDVTIGTPFSEQERLHLTDQQLGDEGKRLYDRVIKLIDEADWSGMPVSPIDHVKARIEQAGYKFGEFTGRSEGIDYSGDHPTYYRRSAAERSKAADVRTEAAFNDGSIDVAVGNESVATGASLHASANYADQRPRVDITWQAHPDVTKHVQMKGRINRTGQVHKPSYLHLLTNVPASKRNAARLEKKLRSLNANTTANQKGLFQSGGVDLLNEIGDRAAATVMENNPAIHRRFGYPLKLAEGARGLETDGAARKITGRMIMLPITEQEKLFAQFETEFKAEHDRAERLGQLKDEARVLDLEAREMAKAQLSKSVRAESPFGGPVFIKQMNVRNMDKPYPFARVMADINSSLGLAEDTDIKETVQNGRQHAAALKDRQREQFQRYHDVSVERASGRRKKTVSERLKGDFARFEKLVDHFPVGRSVLLKTPDGKEIYGVMAGLRKRGGAINPIAPAAWTAKIYLADGAKEIDLRLNELALPGEKAFASDYTLIKADQASLDIDGKLEVRPISDAFDNPSRSDREERLIATGNILAAADRFPDARVTYFTTVEGKIEAGLLMPRDAKITDVLTQAQVPLEEPSHVRKFLDEDGEIVTTDNAFTLIKRKNKIELRGSRARATGGKYWLDQSIRSLTGDFVSSGSAMVASIKPDQLDDLLSIMKTKKMTLKAASNLEKAREITGIEKPIMEEKKLPKSSMPKPDRFVMPWEIRGETAAPFAASLQFSTGRPVALREESEGTLVAVNHQGAPGPQPDGSRIHRILDVPEYLSAEQLAMELHLSADPGRYVHNFNRVYFSTGAGDTGLVVYNDEEVRNFPPHHQYDTWAMRRGPAPDGWKEADVPLLSPTGPLRYPGFTHPEAPGLAVVPFPRPGLRPGVYDKDAVRYVVIHKESGNALLPGNRYLYTARGAAAAALYMAGKHDFSNLSAPDTISNAERAHLNTIVQNGYEEARGIDRDAYIDINLKQGVTAEFRESDLYWLVVENAADPDIDLAAEMAQVSGCFYLYPDRDTALDVGMEDAAPVRARLGNIADLTREPWPDDVRKIARDFFDYNHDLLQLGLSSSYYDMAIDFEEVQAEIAKGVSEDEAIETFVEAQLAKFDYDAFEDAIRRQDYRAAGAYDGDVKDALMGWLSDGFDGVKLWEPHEYDKHELVIFNARDVELAWDQLETSIEMARQEKAEEAIRREAWEQERGEKEIERLQEWKTEQLEGFDLSVLQERGFNVNDVHWLSVPNKEFPELDKAYAGENPVLFTRRTDAQSEGMFDEAVPVYLRRGQGVDLTTDNAAARDFLDQLAQVPGISQASLSQLPGGDVGDLASAILDLSRVKGLDYVQFIEDGTKRSVLADTSDVVVAWDAIQRKSIHRRMSDTMVGPALAAAKQAAALEAPRLLLTGPDGRETAEMEAKAQNIFLQAEEVRRSAGNDALLIFVDGDKAQLFDRDAKNAHAIVETLPLVEIGDIAEIEIPANEAAGLAEQLAAKHRVVIARLDENGEISLETFQGNHVELEKLSAEEANDPVVQQEREKKRARQRASTWSEKPLADRYADLHLAARNREVPALADGERYIIAGLLARQLSDDVPLLKQNLSAQDDVTWFGTGDVANVTSALAALNKRLMLAEGLSRATWKQARVGGTEESHSVEEVDAQTTIDQHAELAKRHPDRVVFVEDGEGYRTFAGNVERIAKNDPALTSKFEIVHDVPSIALTRDEMDYQANQMTRRGLRVSVAQKASDGSVSLRNFDPQTEVVNDSDVSSAISGENKDEVVSARIPTQTEQDRENLARGAANGQLAEVIRVFDEQKPLNTETVHIIEHEGDYLLFDGDARLVAQHFEPVRNRLEYVADSIERQRVVGRLSANVLERAIEQLRGRSLDIVVLRHDGDDYKAEAHGATRHQPEYGDVAREAASRRGFDLSKKAYSPVTAAGAFPGKPLIDGVVLYNDPIAAGGNQIEVHTRIKNPARMNSNNLQSHTWRHSLQKMVENLKPAYGIDNVEQLKQILSDGRLVSWWSERLLERGTGGDPMDLQRSVFSELRKLGYDAAIMIDQDGYEVTHAFDPEMIIPAHSVKAQHVQQTPANVSGNANSPARSGTFSPQQNSATMATPEFRPNRFGIDGLQVSVQATPQTREELKSALDEITRAFDGEGSTPEKRANYLRETGLLNASLAGRISRYTEDVYPILPGYVIYPGDNGKWVYATVRDFVSATGPNGSLYGRWAPEMSDQIADYAAFYLTQLDAAFEPQLSQVKEELMDLVSEINPDVDLQFVDRLFADGTVEGSPDRRPVLGLYFRHTDAMPISTDISKGDPRITGLHELYHSLTPLLSPEELRVVSAGFGGEEKAAEAFAHWAMGNSEGKRLGPIANLYQRMNNILRGNGFRSWQDVFQVARSGNVARRANVLEMSSDIEIPVAQNLAKAANLPALGEAVSKYGTRLNGDSIPMETLYQLFAQHLDDLEITKAARKAGFHRISDEQNISSIPRTRQQTIELDLARHKKLTPIDVGSNDPYIAQRLPQGTQAQARRMTGVVAPSPAIQRRADRPHVIRFKTSDGTILQSNVPDRTSMDGVPVRSKIKDVMLQERDGHADHISADYLQHNVFIAINGDTGMNMVSAGQEIQIPMATRGSADIISATARPVFIVPDDMDRLIAEGIVGEGNKGLQFDATSGAYYVAESHPDIERLVSEFGTSAAQERWQAHRNAQEASVERVLQEFNTITHTVPKEDRVYIYPIGQSELQMARAKGAQFDRGKNRVYFIDKNSPEASNLISRFGPTEERMEKYREWRRQQFNEEITRRSVASVDTAAMDNELGPNAVRQIGRSALFSAGIGAVGAGIAQASAANDGSVNVTPPEGQIEMMFERLGAGEWREILEKSEASQTAMQLWDSLSTTTKEALNRAGIAGERAADQFAEAFGSLSSTLEPYSELTSRVVSSGSWDEAKSHILTFMSNGGENVNLDNFYQALTASEDPALRLEAMKSIVYSSGNAVSEFASDSFNTLTTVDESLITSLRDMKDRAAETIADAAPAQKSAFASTFDNWMDSARDLTQPVVDTMRDAISPKVTAAVTAIGGSAGLTAVASGAASAGVLGAGVAASVYMARRNERRKMWAEDARDMPWKLTTKQFGQVAKKHYSIARSKENGIETVTVKRKSDGEKIVQAAAPLGGKLSAREMIEKAHAAMVKSAIDDKLPVPQTVINSVTSAEQRDVGAEHTKVGPAPLNQRVGKEMLEAYVSKTPAVMAAGNDKGVADQLTKLPTPVLASAALKTGHSERESGNPDRKQRFKNGMALINAELRRRNESKAGEILSQSLSKSQSQAKQGPTRPRRKGPSR